MFEPARFDGSVSDYGSRSTCFFGLVRSHQSCHLFMMPEVSLRTLLAARNAQLVDGGVDFEVARQRSTLTRRIAESFSCFEGFRDGVIDGESVPLNDLEQTKYFVMTCLDYGLISESASGEFFPVSAGAKRYLRGGWLEEYAGLAAKEAGADEVRIGQTVRWSAGGYSGVNEIDALARFGHRMLFISAKGLRSQLGGSAQHREKLMAALQEADNISDHFGNESSVVFLVVTTDLYDERRHKPRYEQLFGKAAALNVELVTLDSISWRPLVARLARLAR